MRGGSTRPPSATTRIVPTKSSNVASFRMKPATPALTNCESSSCTEAGRRQNDLYVRELVEHVRQPLAYQAVVFHDRDGDHARSSPADNRKETMQVRQRAEQTSARTRVAEDVPAARSSFPRTRESIGSGAPLRFHQSPASAAPCGTPAPQATSVIHADEATPDARSD
jgi:hypothetical protein